MNAILSESLSAPESRINQLEASLSYVDSVDSPLPSSSLIASSPVEINGLIALTSAADQENSRTIVHVFEPVRDHHDEVIDFRLTLRPADAPSASSFTGIKLVECGPSVAPGDIFLTLKRVLNSGEAIRTMTRHRVADRELIFHQTAIKSGDSVIATTSITTGF